MSIPGNGLLLRLPFPDNNKLSGKRTFLSIGEEDGYIHLLNVSSIIGKESKLLKASNEKIIKFNPPFDLPSMVKLDALYRVEVCNDLNRCILCNGHPLDADEFDRIYGLYQVYKSKSGCWNLLPQLLNLKSI